MEAILLKNILIKCCELLSRDDLKNDLLTYDSVENIPTAQSKKDITRLISYYNFITNDVCENYIDLTVTEKFTADSEGCVSFDKFSNSPKKIISVSINGKNICFSLFTTFIKCSYKNSIIEVQYSYLPKQISSFNSETPIKHIGIQKSIIYGIVSEFYASKNQYNESEFWHAKFMQELFRIKIKKERHLRSTFEL